MRRLRTFRGGTHPPEGKDLSRDAAVRELSAPAELVVPLAQHIGRPASACVKAGERVLRGQRIGKAEGFISANVHAPVSGKVKRLVPCNTPLGLVSEAVLLENDGADAWAGGLNEPSDAALLSAEAIRARVQEAGIVGMGGAAFPTHVKLSPPDGKVIDTVILNGVECEPFLTADYRLMLESPRTVIEGFKLILRAVRCARGVVAVEANKPDAFAVMEEACRRHAGEGVGLSAALLEVKYPQGAEKQLIHALTGRETPSGGLPMDVGVLVQNAGTAHAVYEACARNRPLTERIVTVTGPGVRTPQNLRVRIGTPVRALLEACGFDAAAARKLVFGGPMMGVAHFDPDLPVNKGMSGVLALTAASPPGWRNCIRCGRCVEGCPQRLVPSELSILIESGRFRDADEIHANDCMECGVCAYVCPARRPIVQWIKLAKVEIARERRREAARTGKEAP
ncbi:MAG: electron transport complex subunit RsxC [Planctomycetota bacterium]